MENKHELTVVTRLSISTVNNAIRELKKAGKLERVGSNKTGFWRTKGQRV